MDPLYAKEHFIFSLIVNVIGILASGLNVTFYVITWTRGKSLNSCDLILMALGISSSCFQCTCIAYTSFKMLDVESIDYTCLVTRQLMTWSGTCSSFFSSGLCVFYCVKIVDFNHPLFFCLKLRIPKMVPWLLLASVVTSLVLSVPSYWEVYKESPQNMNNTTTTVFVHEQVISYAFYEMLVLILGNCLPILFCIPSITLILISIARHVRRMKENAVGFSQPRLAAHFGAARMVGYLLLNYILLFLGMWGKLFTTSPLFFLICQAIIDSCMPAQCIILILNNTILKQVLCKLLKLRS